MNQASSAPSAPRTATPLAAIIAGAIVLIVIFHFAGFHFVVSAGGAAR